ncbi:hypothetical protein AAH991_39515 [Microbispora sp. ZYX-F-249]|uniref:Type II secretion system protein GspF domain-containing protein n=1 Tax=Microbispora maris TaxID=3144104 RepID=A0ABV0B2E5_9ACTN
MAAQPVSWGLLSVQLARWYSFRRPATACRRSIRVAGKGTTFGAPAATWSSGSAASWPPTWGRCRARTADLALLGRPVERFLAVKLGLAVLGLLLPAAVSALMTVMGGTPGVALPAGAYLLGGVALFFAPDLTVRSEAARRRADFRHAITGYLDLVALERSAGAGPVDALEKAASVSDGWAFARISAVLEQARRNQRPAWEGLARLGRQVGINAPTWPTSPPSPGRKAPASWTPSSARPPPCAARLWLLPEPKQTAAPPPWSSPSPCSARPSCCY